MGWLSAVFGVHNPGPILAFLPTIMVGVLFGLAMDYQLFISSGMRESYAHGAPSRVAVMDGLHAGRAVVAAAAIIMISVFGGFVFAESAMIRPIGFGLAFGVLLDAFLVRLLLMPALMHLVGDAPGAAQWLDPIRPNVTSRARPGRDHDYSTTRICRRRVGPRGNVTADRARPVDPSPTQGTRSDPATPREAPVRRSILVFFTPGHTAVLGAGRMLIWVHEACIRTFIPKAGAPCRPPRPPNGHGSARRSAATGLLVTDQGLP